MDITKPELSGGWLLNLFVIIIVLVLLFGLAVWFTNSIKTAILGPKGSTRRAFEPRI